MYIQLFLDCCCVQNTTCPIEYWQSVFFFINADDIHQKSRRTDGWTVGRTDRRTDGSMDGQLDGQNQERCQSATDRPDRQGRIWTRQQNRKCHICIYIHIYVYIYIYDSLIIHDDIYIYTLFLFLKYVQYVPCMCITSATLDFCSSMFACK